MIPLAVRARTIAATATTLDVGVLDRTEPLLRHALGVDGSLLFLPPPGSPLRAAALLPTSPVVTATAHDVAPVPTADRVRGTVVLGGRPRPVDRRLPAPLVAWLCGEDPAPGTPILELRPTSVHLRWRVEGGEELRPVPVEEYAAAQPDPLAGWEGGFLRHLDEEHGDLLVPLARRAGLPVPPGWRVRPVLADAEGLVVRASGPGGTTPAIEHDVRLPFPRPAGCGCDAVAGFNRLLADAGLGARAGGAGRT